MANVLREEKVVPTKPLWQKALTEANATSGGLFGRVRREGNPSLAYQAIKRSFDVVGALALIIFLSPVLLGSLAVLMITTKGNPFFVQWRAGFLGRNFRMLKFRTMRLDAEKMKHLVKNDNGDDAAFKSRRDPRVTRFGRLLRRLSIDEMPQLFNVLRGDMSLVGPRPQLLVEAANYGPWHRRRLSVNPGLTCLWQVSGRSEIGFEDWVRLDIWYVQNQSLWTDLVLLWKTPWSVFSGRGAY